ncbi:zf-PARP-domain-containing protein [Lentinula boryana]|uniref:Zf-PARP-domain-containing protein n=1 Tax=Lentinula boryana TaxID=40481 RepID=A0ABQ8Q0N9_9AGAR|nr:zf-PARP-domain-containing protein [Lentinula boryana]
MPGYRLEYASSSRAKCKGPKPCAGSTLPKGCLRFGSTVEFQGKQSFAWRHWGCVTSKVLSNVRDEHPDASDVDGFEELRPEDQQKVIKAWEEGKVADEDIPETARKADGDEDEDDGEKPKRKARATKKKADDDGEEKPKKARATKAKPKVSLRLVCSKHCINSVISER